MVGGVASELFGSLRSKSLDGFLKVRCPALKTLRGKEPWEIVLFTVIKGRRLSAACYGLTAVGL